MFHRLLGYQKNRLNLGLLVSNKTNQKGKDKEDETRLAGSSSESAFGSMQLEDKLKLEDKLTALVHIDRNFDPHAGEGISYLSHATTATSNTIIWGRLIPAANTRIILNPVAILYDGLEKGGTGYGSAISFDTLL